MGKDVLIVTTNEVPGYEIEEVYGYISVNYVSGADFIKDFFAGFTSFFGGISESYTDEINSLKDEARRALEKKAIALNMNCILGIKIDLDPIFSDKYSMFMVSATGTAVRLTGYGVNNSSEDTNVIDIKRALQNVYVAKNTEVITYDFTKMSKRVFEEYLYEFCEAEIKMLIDHILKTYTEAYAVAALAENRSKVQMLGRHIIANNLRWAIEYLHNDMSKAKALLIRDMNIINYNMILNNFKNKDFVGNKEVLFITLMARPEYIDEAQFNGLLDLLKYLQNTYSDEVEIKEVGAFKKKSVWICKKCKNGIDLDIQHCPTCEIDKMGLNVALKAKDKIEHLKKIRDGLSKYYIK